MVFARILCRASLCLQRGHQPSTHRPKQLHIAGILPERPQVGGRERRILGQRAVRNVMLGKNSPLTKSQPGVRANEIAIEISRGSSQSIQPENGFLMPKNIELGQRSPSRFMKSRPLASGRTKRVWVDVVPFAPPE